jgi:hypothetical protein
MSNCDCQTMQPPTTGSIRAYARWTTTRKCECKPIGVLLKLIEVEFMEYITGAKSKETIGEIIKAARPISHERPAIDTYTLT